MFNKIITVIVVNLILVLCSEQPQYQVSIWMKHPGLNNNATHLCNGAIIHERLILTTANCLHYKVVGSAIVNPIGASMITVLAGSLNTPAKSLIYSNVSRIDIAKGFNATTLENDLAILKLNESLPLDERSDIKWIILDDHYDHQNNSCYVNFYNISSTVKNIQQTQSVKIMENFACTNSINKSSSIRKNDICSLYFLSSGSICNITADETNSSSDRGTALLCDSKLIGLLSQIIPRDVRLKCSHSRTLNAIYTRVATYLDWIYSKIAIESITDIQKNHTMAPPYVASAPAPSISDATITTNNILPGPPPMPTIQPATTAIPQKQTTHHPNISPKSKSNSSSSTSQLKILSTLLSVVTIFAFSFIIY